MTKEMTARYGGTCAGCGNAIRRGHRIAWNPRTRQAYHIEHAPAPTPAEASKHEDASLAAYVAAGLGEV